MTYDHSHKARIRLHAGWCKFSTIWSLNSVRLKLKSVLLLFSGIGACVFLCPNGQPGQRKPVTAKAISRLAFLLHSNFLSALRVAFRFPDTSYRHYPKLSVIDF